MPFYRRLAPAHARRILLLAAILLAPLPSTPASAAKQILCPATAPDVTGMPTRPPAPDPDQPIEIRADEVSAVAGTSAEFTGRVELTRGAQHLTTDRLAYDKATDVAQARGTVTLENDAGDRFETSELSLNLHTRVGHAGPSTYLLGQKYGRGDAGRIDFAGPTLTRLQDVRYTTCAPGQDDWFLHTRELELDTAEDIGTARHAWLDFKGVPIFYFPYVSFPISDQRKSGFLIPRLGHSGQSGYQVATPYYFNLAPDYDDTLTPRFLSKRGLQLANEFRYLGPRSGGKLELAFLPDDKKFGDDRAAGSFIHNNAFTPLWSAAVDVRGVSDKFYLDDFGEHVGVTSQTHLPQNAEINRRGPVWNFTARAAGYQTLDPAIAPADRPYARLPQFVLSANPSGRINTPQYQFDSEWVRFERGGRLNGDRASLSPAVSLPFTSSYGFLTPRVGARYIGYDLARGDDSTPALARGVVSLDSGLFFERDTDWLGRGYVQTLEPRLYYLYVPYQNQDGLPNFDTSVPDFSFANLFRDNRFVGGDRVGDANQLTTAVTSRYLDADDGAERFRGSLGLIHYFDDRRVNLPAGTTTRTDSDIVAEAAARLARNWYAQGGLQWNQDEDRAEKRNVYLQYNPEKNKIVNLGYRYTRNEIEQTDVSTEWPLAGRWSLRARSLYSERDHRNVETYAGLDYNTCCWALRAFLSRRYSESAGQVKAILFEFELSGLSKRGNAPVSPLEQSLFFPRDPARPALR